MIRRLQFTLSIIQYWLMNLKFNSAFLPRRMVKIRRDELCGDVKDQFILFKRMAASDAGLVDSTSRLYTECRNRRY